MPWELKISDCHSEIEMWGPGKRGVHAGSLETRGEATGATLRANLENATLGGKKPSRRGTLGWAPSIGNTRTGKPTDTESSSEVVRGCRGGGWGHDG